MAFDDIPEDLQESFPCPECDNGSVEMTAGGRWECDKCDFGHNCGEPD